MEAVHGLETRLDKWLAKSFHRLYLEARDRVKEMRETVEMLKSTDIEQALGELDRYAGTTVNDLRVFMQRHGLQFADASTPDEIELFPNSMPSSASSEIACRKVWPSMTIPPTTEKDWRHA